MNTTLILDSSVIAKWFFSEENSTKALKIKDKFAENSISIAIPLLLYYEVNNILKTAVKSFRVDADEAKEVYGSFLQLNFVAYSSESILENTLKIALDYDISAYDASYIALAEYLQIPFLTADRKLLNKISSKLVINLDDYQI